MGACVAHGVEVVEWRMSGTQLGEYYWDLAGVHRQLQAETR